MVTSKNISQLKELVNYAVSVPRLFVLSLRKIRLTILKLRPDIEGLINQLSKKCVMLILLTVKYPFLKEKILSTSEFLLKNNMTILLDNLNTSDQKILNILHIQLFKISALELISKKEDYKLFWTPVLKDLSGRLLSLTETGYVDSDLNLSKQSLKSQEELSPLLMTNNIRVPNKNCQKISYQLSKYIVANKWNVEGTKSLKVKIKPSNNQLKILNEWFSTCNFLYNQTISLIKNGTVSSRDNNKIRDLIVTKETKKYHPEYIEMSNGILKLHQQLKEVKKSKDVSKIKNLEQLIIQRNQELRNLAKTLPYQNNNNVTDWQTKTPKKIRSDAIDDVCKAYKSATANLKAGNINNFSVRYRKKRDNTSLSIPGVCIVKDLLKLVKDPIKTETEKIDMGFVINSEVLKKLENITIKTIRLIRKKGCYYIMVPVPIIKKEEKKSKKIRYCGIDLGSRTFATSVGNNGAVEYKFKTEIINNIDKKLDHFNKIKFLRQRPRPNNYKRPIRNKTFNKLENKKSNCIDELHWKSIKHILDNNDIVFIGDIKSHGIVKNKEHQKKLNRDINNLKFYVFKQRLMYKSFVRNKHTFLIPEQHTTKTCSCCGHLNYPEKSETYNCLRCKKIMGRDLNAAKNILMKGLVKLDIL